MVQSFYFAEMFQCLRKWGYRRCEDICWIKTNKNNPGKTKTLDPKAVFQRTKVPLRISFCTFSSLCQLI